MRTERLASRYGLDVRWIHFPLHPETPPEGMSLEELFAGRGFDLETAKAQMRQRMEAEGLPYGERTHTYNSRLAQELAVWAEMQEGGEGIHDALFRLYFVDGANLADAGVLLDLVEGLGLSCPEAQRVLEDRAFASRVDDDWDLSRRMGVTGVPTFVAGDRVAVGAQPYEVLEGLLTAVGATPVS